MRITVVGRGNVGGGLARLWAAAGHEIETLGREGGDASGADVVIIAVPAGAVADALGGVSGLGGQVAIDACNVVGERNEQFESLAHEVKSIVGGPVAKAFNINFARLYDQIANQRARPSNLYAADDDAREVTEQLTRDAGYDPVYVGDLSAARLLEENIRLVFAISQAGLGQFFYRMARPGEL